MWPLSPQSTNPTVAWNAIDPFGNAINCTGTNSQCFNEFVAAAATNGWSEEMLGPGTLQTSVQLVIPPCNGRSKYIDATINFNWTVSQGSSDYMTIDSIENCYQIFRGVVSQRTGDTGAVVRWKPTNPTQGGGGHVVGTASYAEFFTAIIPASGGTGLIWDLANGSIFGNEALIFNDINLGTNGFIVTNPGSGTIVFEHNKIYPGYLHGQTGKVVQEGTNSTNAAGMRENTWNSVRIDTDANPTVAWDSWASNDTYLGLSIVNEIGIAATGLKFEAGANNNSLHGGRIAGTTPLNDGGTCNTYIGTRGVAGTLNNIPCASLTTPVLATAAPTSAGALGLNGPNINFGDGSTNRVVVSIDQAQTITNKTVNCANNTCNVTVGSLNSGTGATSSTFWRGDGTWAAPSLAAASPITNSLGADVAMNVSANYFSGPTVAQGTTGTWFASGNATVLDTASAVTMFCKLWDGTSIIDSGSLTTGGANFSAVMHLSGFLATPAGNIRIDCRDSTATTGVIKFNATGNSKDSTITAYRIQ